MVHISNVIQNDQFKQIVYIVNKINIIMMQLVLYRNPNVEGPAHRKLNQHCVQIDKQDRLQFQAFATLELIKEWKVKELRLSGNERACLLPEISHIKFPSLRLINLSGNGIESIEGLSRIWMPYLQTIRLASNSLVCLADLRKANWPSLLELGLIDNRIPEGNQISCLPSPKLKSILLEWTQDPLQCFDIRWTAKLQSLNLKYLTMNSRRRLTRTGVESTLRSKYNRIEIRSMK